MKKSMIVLAVFSILSFGLAAHSHALTMLDGTKLVGAMVKARDGVDLGRIFDVVIASEGDAGFAIVDQVVPPGAEGDLWGGHVVAVPFSALTISKGNSRGLRVVFNADKEKFYEAPDAPSVFFQNGGQVSPQEVIQIDRYFGVEPYWTYPYED